MRVAVDETPDISQESLLTRAKAGHADAFGDVLRPLQDRFYRHALALCGQPTDAEDLVQETFLAAWRSLGRFDGSCQFSTWLYSILLHRHKKYLRARRTRPPSAATLSGDDLSHSRRALDSLPSAEPAPSAQLERSEWEGLVRRQVLALPWRHRRVIVLRFFADASLDEIAAVLRCSVGTVKSRLHYALDRLRRNSLNLPRPPGDIAT